MFLLDCDLIVKRPVLFTVLAVLAFAGPDRGFAAGAVGEAATPAKTASGVANSSSTTVTQGKSRRVLYRYGQQAPTRTRYKQIQTALARRGFSPGPIDGQWGSKTSAALKRFEQAHNLRADGRLDSLTLIVLGLGPRRLSSVSSEE